MTRFLAMVLLLAIAIITSIDGYACQDGCTDKGHDATVVSTCTICQRGVVPVELHAVPPPLAVETPMPASPLPLVRLLALRAIDHPPRAA